MDIGEKINVGLQRKKMDRKDLAKLMEVNPSAVAKWISGRTKPPADKLLKIIKILELYEEFFPEKFSVARKQIEDQKLGRAYVYLDAQSIISIEEKMSHMQKEIEELKEIQQKQTT